MTEPGCRFCRANGLLSDPALLETRHFYLLSSQDPTLQRAAMIVPHRHSENPFEMTPEIAAADRATMRLLYSLPPGPVRP